MKRQQVKFLSVAAGTIVVPVLLLSLALRSSGQAAIRDAVFGEPSAQPVTQRLGCSEGEASFQQGVNDYLGCTNTVISKLEPTPEPRWKFCTMPLISVKTDGSIRTLIRFEGIDSCIPTNTTTIKEAYLDLHIAPGSMPAANQVHAYIIRKAWTACEANWNDATYQKTWKLPGCDSTAEDRFEDEVGLAEILPTERVYRIHFTRGEEDSFGAIVDWLRHPESNSGLLLKTDPDTLYQIFGFYSCTHPNPAQRPKLVIRYTPPPPSAPEPITPTHGLTVCRQESALEWSPVARATEYALQVCPTLDCASPAISTTLNSTSCALSSVPKGQLPTGSYVWRVAASNASGRSEWSTADFALDDTPVPPTLERPIDSSPICPGDVTFTWRQVGNARYYLQIATDADFQSVVREIWTNETSYTATLSSPGDYHWRVRAGTPPCVGPWSAYGTFVVNAPLAAPALLTPQDGSIGCNHRPEFCWLAVQDATTYTLEISENADFEPPTTRAVVTLARYQPTTNLPNATLHWRVVANNGPCSSAASSRILTLATSCRLYLPIELHDHPPCPETIVDGDFGDNEPSPRWLPQVSVACDQQQYSCSRGCSAYLGKDRVPNHVDEVYQDFRVLSPPITGTLSFCFCMSSLDPSNGDKFDVSLADPASGTQLAVVAHVDNGGKARFCEKYTYVFTADDLSRIAAAMRNPVRILFRLTTDNKNATAVWIDDVSLVFCDAP